jgi:hypothetical protein
MVSDYFVILDVGKYISIFSQKVSGCFMDLFERKREIHQRSLDPWHAIKQTGLKRIATICGWHWWKSEHEQRLPTLEKAKLCAHLVCYFKYGHSRYFADDQFFILGRLVIISSIKEG